MSVININGINLIVSGNIIKVGELKDAYWLKRDSVPDPERIIKLIKDKKAKIDIFTFSQTLPDTSHKYKYYMEWDNIAALPIETFDTWWVKQINDKTRNMVRRAQKRGVEVRVADFDNAFIKGIADIYNETPVRQGRTFLHYGKDIDSIRIENSSFLDRSDFIGAYCNDELIGFIKLVYVDEVAGMMQILSKVKARDLAPNNALIAKAVEICAAKGIMYLTYAKFIYGKKGIDPVAQFKHHNGFKKVDIQTYYAPLSIKGSIALKLGLHHGYIEFIPKSLLLYLIKIREAWYRIKS